MFKYILQMIKNGMDEKEVEELVSSEEFELSPGHYKYLKFDNDTLISSEFLSWLTEVESRRMNSQVLEDYFNLIWFEDIKIKENKLEIFATIIENVWNEFSLDEEELFIAFYNKMSDSKEPIFERTIKNLEYKDLDLNWLDKKWSDAFSEENSTLKRIIQMKTNPVEWINNSLDVGLIDFISLMYMIENWFEEFADLNLEDDTTERVKNFWRSIDDSYKSDIAKIIYEMNQKEIFTPENLETGSLYITGVYDAETFCDYIDKIVDKINSKEAKAQERKDRISFEDAVALIKENSLTDEIHLMKGSIGLEDMTFDYIIYRGEPYGCDNFNGRVWVNNREFGDNKIKRSVLEGLIKKIKDQGNQDGNSQSN